MKIQARSHPYTVEEFSNLQMVLKDFGEKPGTFCIADARVLELYENDFQPIPSQRIYGIAASEEQKSFERLTPIFGWLLQNGLRRDGSLLVVGGGVLQDIGCFIASVLFRGLRWELVPTTLLAQCDSCIGSKSSINIQSYKNQIGTFYPPHRICLVPGVLKTLSWDDVRSGMGEAIKLRLLTSEDEFQSLMTELQSFSPGKTISPHWIWRSLEIKKSYIETDEFDQGIRLLLNYGHTFGHAFESASHYRIPHGIGVTLGMLAATFVSFRLGWIGSDYFAQLKSQLFPWCEPFHKELQKLDLETICASIKHDKKNTRNAVNCILTRGAGKMEKTAVNLDQQLRPWIAEFIFALG